MTDTTLQIITTKPETIPIFRIENFDELKLALQGELAKYKGLVYTEDNITEAKKDRARLNAFAERLDKARIAQKKAALLNQYEIFEKQCNELKSLVLAPKDEIDAQIKVFEEKARAEKLEKVRELYLQHFDGIKGIATFDLILNEKWINATFSLKRVNEELQIRAEQVRNDLAAIANACRTEEIKKMALLSYSKDLILSNALMTAERETKRLAELEAAMEEKARKEAEEKAKAEGANQLELALAQQPEADRQPPADIPPVATAEPRRRIDFSVWATPEEAKMIRQFLIDARIKYSAVFTKEDKEELAALFYQRIHKSDEEVSDGLSNLYKKMKTIIPTMI